MKTALPPTGGKILKLKIKRQSEIESELKTRANFLIKTFTATSNHLGELHRFLLLRASSFHRYRVLCVIRPQDGLGLPHFSCQSIAQVQLRRYCLSRLELQLSNHPAARFVLKQIIDVATQLHLRR